MPSQSQPIGRRVFTVPTPGGISLSANKVADARFLPQGRYLVRAVIQNGDSLVYFVFGDCWTSGAAVFGVLAPTNAYSVAFELLNFGDPYELHRIDLDALGPTVALVVEEYPSGVVLPGVSVSTIGSGLVPHIGA